MDWLTRQGVQYSTVYLDDDPEATDQRIQEISGQEYVPFTIVEHADGTTQQIIGSHHGPFRKLLKKRGTTE
jgi:glutaredoxin